MHSKFTILINKTIFFRKGLFRLEKVIKKINNYKIIKKMIYNKYYLKING